MTQNIKIIRIILGILLIASACYPVILYFNYLPVLMNADIIRVIIPGACFVVIGIMIIKKRNTSFVFTRQKIIFLIIFILLAGTWLFYISNQQTHQSKKMYDIERTH